MSINTRDELIDALANNSSYIVIDKSSIASMAAGQYASLWRATGQPVQAAIPGTSAAIPTSATTGAMGFANQTAPAESYLGWLFASSSNSASNLEIHDRVGHMGGLVGNITTSQTVGLDLSSGGLNLVSARLGDSNFSDLQWWMEWYTDTGATASNATINVTFNDGTSADLTVVAVGGTVRAGRMIPLIPLIPVAHQGKYIRDVNTVILSASTGTAGNFGFTATRPRTAQGMPLLNLTNTWDWAQLGLPTIPNNACLQIIMLCSTTSSGLLRGGCKIAHG